MDHSWGCHTDGSKTSRRTPLHIRPRSSNPVNKIIHNTGRESLNQFTWKLHWNVSMITDVFLNEKSSYMWRPYIYSLLIEKEICDHWNVSVRYLCVYLCFSSRDFFRSRKKSVIIEMFQLSFHVLCVPFIWRSLDSFGKSFLFLVLSLLRYFVSELLMVSTILCKSVSSWGRQSQEGPRGIMLAVHSTHWALLWTTRQERMGRSPCCSSPVSWSSTWSQGASSLLSWSSCLPWSRSQSIPGPAWSGPWCTGSHSLHITTRQSIMLPTKQP